MSWKLVIDKDGYVSAKDIKWWDEDDWNIFDDTEYDSEEEALGTLVKRLDGKIALKGQVTR